jgi:hypothetical protein
MDSSQRNQRLYLLSTTSPVTPVRRRRSGARSGSTAERWVPAPKVDDDRMAMPNDLVLVRHGQSEANIIQKADKAASPHPREADLNDRPDWQQRLSPLGIEQAKRARTWIDENLGGVGSFGASGVSCN